MAVSTPEPVTGYAAGAYTLDYPGGRVNVRSGPSTGAGIVGTVGHGDAVDVLESTGTTEGKWLFQRVSVPGLGRGYMATKGGAWKFDPRNVDVELWQDVKAVRDTMSEAVDTLTAALRAAGVE